MTSSERYVTSICMAFANEAKGKFKQKSVFGEDAYSAPVKEVKKIICFPVKGF